jgi:hypothetical protein
MREDLPSRELQDLRPVPGDGKLPLGWLRSIDRACTAWLLKRHQLGSPAQHRVTGAEAPKLDEEDESGLYFSAAGQVAIVSKEVAR